MSNNRNRNRRPQQSPDSHTNGLRPFRFRHGEQTFTIPAAAEATKNLKAGALIDAAEGDDEMAQVRFFMAMLKAADPSPDAMAALRDMDLERFGRVMQEWTERTGAHRGKSGPSSA